VGATFRLLSICRLVEKKGLETIFHAVAILQNDGFAVSLDVTGAGPEAPRLQALRGSLGLTDVRLLGPASRCQVAEALTRADALICGNQIAADGDRDGIPNIVLEAMAAAVPVIATDVGGLAEIVSNKQTGWLVPPRDAGALARAVREAAADEAQRQTIAMRGRMEVERHFALGRSVAQLAALFDRCVLG
jgi:glycosyltransferase involved in cell wall biosynthesis